MSQFAPAFQRWSENLPSSTCLAQLATLGGLHLGTTYDIRAGKKQATPAFMEKLLPIVAQNDSQVSADRLLIAYLQDHIPAGFENELTIELRNAEIVTPDLLEAAIAYHAQRAAQDTAYAEHLISLYLLSRESDLTQIDELVARWHAEHTPPSVEPTSKPQPVLSSTTQEQDNARVAEDETP